MISISELPVPDPAVRAFHAVMRLLFGSFFNFLIILGVVLIALGATVATGVEAGHLGIYGATSIFVGVVGRVIAYLKIQDA